MNQKRTGPNPALATENPEEITGGGKLRIF